MIWALFVGLPLATSTCVPHTTRQYYIRSLPRYDLPAHPSRLVCRDLCGTPKRMATSDIDDCHVAVVAGGRDARLVCVEKTTDYEEVRFRPPN